MKIVLIASLILCIEAVAWGCSFDTDCQVGSKCEKPQGSIYGVCKGGLYPGNSNDDKPVKAFPDLDKTYGNTCSFDLDCGISNKCVKKSGSIYGVCLTKEDKQLNEGN